METGPPTDVLDAQVQQGFAFVSQGCCEALLLSKGKSVPPGEEEDVDRKTQLALACIAAIKPDMKSEEVAQKINQGYLLENPDCYAELNFDEDALNDVLDKGEAKKISEYIAHVEKSKAKKEVVMQTREKFMGTYFKVSPAPKPSAAAKKQPRWLPDMDKGTTGKIFEWILKHTPSDIDIQCDDYNGRWRVISPLNLWRSVSWTKRGHKVAAMEVVHQAWLYEKDWSGHSAPFDLEELAKNFE